MNWLLRGNVRLAGYLLALMVILFTWSQRPAVGGDQGQDDAAKTDADKEDKTDEPKKKSGNRFFDKDSLGWMIFIKSGWVGVIFYGVLAIFSIIAMAVTLERLINLTRGKIMPPGFTMRLFELVRNKTDTAANFRSLCDTNPSPIASILRAGLHRSGRPLPEVEKAMEDAAAREMSALRSRNRPLNVIGAVAPLVGLLGTVVGMIIAFRVSSQESLDRPELLAEGIYLALMTTAAGLTIAIPCLLLVPWLNGRVERYMRDIDECLLETMPCFTKLESSDGVVMMSPPSEGATPAAETPAASTDAAS